MALSTMDANAVIATQIKKERSPLWTEAEKASLVVIVTNDDDGPSYYDKLCSKFEGAKCTAKTKGLLWEEIHSKYSASNIVCSRTVEQCQKQLLNIKQRAKEKHDYNMKTGVGQPRHFTVSENLLWDKIKERPGSSGIKTHIDTEATLQVISNSGDNGSKKTECVTVEGDYNVLADIQIVHPDLAIQGTSQAKNIPPEHFDVLPIDNKSKNLKRKIFVEDEDCEFLGMNITPEEMTTVKRLFKRTVNQIEKENLILENIKLRRQIQKMN